MAITYTVPTIDEYLGKRLMLVEGAVSLVQGIEMYAREPIGFSLILVSCESC